MYFNIDRERELMSVRLHARVCVAFYFNSLIQPLWPLIELLTKAWKQHHILSLDLNFVLYSSQTMPYGPKISANPFQGYTDDDENAHERRRLTAAQSVANLELMLGQIVNNCPTIPRNITWRISTSI